MTERLRRHRYAAIILALYLILATAYNLSDPLFEPPDELLHYRFTRYLQQHRELPVVDVDGPLSEDHQAPLYYSLVAVISPQFADEALASYQMGNPFWGYDIGRVGRDNKNQYLHLRNDVPFPEVRWTLHLVRALSTLFGAGMLVLTYLLAQRFLRPPLALATMAVAAFTPNFLLTTSAITNDALQIVFSVAAGLMIVDMVARDEAPSPREWLLLSMIMGFGILSKVGFWPLLPTSALAVALLAHRLKSWRLFLTAGVILLGGVALISGWWLLRNQQLYQDVTALSIMWEQWGRRPPMQLADYQIEAHNFRTTFWANFGYGNVPMPGWVYAALDVFMLGGAAGLVLSLIGWLRGTQKPDRKRRDQIVILIVWATLTVAALLWYMQSTYSVTGRQLYAIMPVIALGLVAGWAALGSRINPHADRWVVGGIVGGMLTFAVGGLVVLNHAYSPAPRSEDTLQGLGWQYGDVAMLMNASIEPQLVHPGDEVWLTLHWLPQRQTEQNLTAFVHLIGVDGQQVGGRDTYPGLGNDPTIDWLTDQVMLDTIPIRIADDAEGPILLDIEAGLYDLETGERLPITDQTGNEVGYPVVGTVKLAETPLSEGNTLDYRLDAVFEGGHRLEGYSVGQGEITLYWASAGTLASSYKVFIHVVDADGNVLTQADGVPRGGRYPTTAWGEGEHFTDTYPLSLTDLEAGRYDVLIGLYEPVSGMRLILSDGRDHIRVTNAISVP